MIKIATVTEISPDESAQGHQLTVQVKEKEGLFLAHCLELDVSSFGETFEEAKEMIQDAMKNFLETASDAEVNRRIAAYQRRHGKSRVYTTHVQVPA
jgi:predicted RNase H-like HicB family nuclease